MTAVIDSTLENVQYKFASIIGELCGKPSVLSQFAVWLDLRLAEYKLKGSISLDCSGVKPDPLWLQGLRDSMLIKQSEAYDVIQSSRHSNINNTREATSRSRSNRTTPKNTSQNFSQDDDRLSPDIVVVKEEPSDSSDIFPVSLHLHDNRSPNRTLAAGDNRKRFSTGSDIPFHSFSSPKSRRMSPSASATSSPLVTHDSSSSDQTIIATGYDIHNQSASASMLSLSETVESGLEQIIRDSDESYNQRGDNSADFHSGTSPIDGSESGMQSFRSGMQSFRSGQPGTSTDAVNDSMEVMRDNSLHFVPDDKLQPGYVDSGLAHRKKVRYLAKEVSTAQGWAKKTVTNITYAIGIFTRWLQESQYKDLRNIHEITPPELDNYLAEFFTMVKKPNGMNYSHTCLRSLRTHLARYLKDTGYPCCIATDSEFIRSQQTLKLKIEALKSAAKTVILH